MPLSPAAAFRPPLQALSHYCLAVISRQCGTGVTTRRGPACHLPRGGAASRPEHPSQPTSRPQAPKHTRTQATCIPWRARTARLCNSCARVCVTAWARAAQRRRWPPQRPRRGRRARPPSPAPRGGRCPSTSAARRNTSSVGSDVPLQPSCVILLFIFTNQPHAERACASAPKLNQTEPCTSWPASTSRHAQRGRGAPSSPSPARQSCAAAARSPSAATPRGT
jgi:hypothetical protein